MFVHSDIVGGSGSSQHLVIAFLAAIVKIAKRYLFIDLCKLLKCPKIIVENCNMRLLTLNILIIALGNSSQKGFILGHSQNICQCPASRAPYNHQQ